MTNYKEARQGSKGELSSQSKDCKGSSRRPRAFDLIVDAGNSAIKAVLVEGLEIVDSLRIPSLLRTDANNYQVEGGFTWADTKENWIVGYDNEGKDCIAAGDSEDGKLVYLGEMLAGVVSTFSGYFENKSKLRVTVLTLQLQHTDLIAEAVAKLDKVVVDGKLLSIVPSLGQVLPESFGCSRVAQLRFKESAAVNVFDLGSGTANLSTYNNRAGQVKRRFFEFEPIGIQVLTEVIAGLLKRESSNAKVDRGLIKFALRTNLYTLGYAGKDIGEVVDKAIVIWLGKPEFQSYLNKIKGQLIEGVPVTACGGGWKIAKVREALLKALDVEGSDLFFIPETVESLGVAGTADAIVAENKAKVEVSKARSEAQKKTKASSKRSPSKPKSNQ